jgi:hypothetical protein
MRKHYDRCDYFQKSDRTVFQCRMTGRKAHRQTGLRCRLEDRDECARRMSSQSLAEIKASVSRSGFVRRK